jgi:hypothetical protein
MTIPQPPIPVLEIHVYHHFPDGVPIRGVLTTLLGQSHSAVRAHVNLKEGETLMAGSTITVDTTTGKASLTWEDDHGDTDAAAPAGIVAVFSSDNPAAATIANDATDALVGDIAPVAEGDTNIGVTFTDGSGNPFLLADGVTPFPDPASVSLHVGPGAANQAVLSINS